MSYYRAFESQDTSTALMPGTSRATCATPNATNNAATSADVLGGFLQMIRMMVSINTIKHLNRHAEETRGLPTVCALHRVPGTQRRLLSNLCLMDRLKR